MSAGCRLDVRRPYAGDALPGPDEVEAFDGVVVLGGAMAAWDDAVAEGVESDVLAHAALFAALSVPTCFVTSSLSAKMKPTQLRSCWAVPLGV